MKNSKIFYLILLGLLLSVFLLACTSTETVSSRKRQELPVNVTMLKFEFIPKVLHIKAGQTVRWNNKEKRQYHSVWFKQQGEQESDYLFPDDTLNKQFNTPGTYPYRCGPHPEMIGTIVVD